MTICHEMRRLEAAGIGGVEAAQELTRRVLGDGDGAGRRSAVVAKDVARGGGDDVAGVRPAVRIRPIFLCFW